MLTKNEITEIRKLHLKKYRQETSSFLVEGTKSVSDLLRSSLKINRLIATSLWLESHQGLLREQNVTAATEKELEKISCLQTPQEVLAITQAPQYQIVDLQHDTPLLALDGIRDPGNLGTIIRTADWFGIRQIVCSEDTVEVWNPKVVQATMGSFTRVKVIYTDLPSFLLQEKNRNIYGTFMEGTPIAKAHFLPNDIVIIGNEGQGISTSVQRLVTHRVTIPSAVANGEKAESLNAALSTGIVLYQWKEKLHNSY